MQGRAKNFTITSPLNHSAMKQLPLQSPSYAYAERGFKEWLDILGYSPTTVYNLPNAIRELLHWMEQQGKKQLHQLTRERFYQSS
jgi:hypothetical protein